MFPVPKVLPHEERLYGKINGKAFEFVGGGSGCPYAGTLSSHLRSTMGPAHFPTNLIGGPILSVGYPTYGKIQEGCSDLFKISNGYEYERHFRFDDGGHIDTRHKIRYFADKLVGDFYVEGEITPPPDVAQIEPLVEVLIPAGPGRIQARMVVGWRTVSHGIYTAEVKTEYRLTHSEELPCLHFRHATFDTNHTQDRLEQDQRVALFRDVTTGIEEVALKEEVLTD